jgi:hypothetical protein
MERRERENHQVSLPHLLLLEEEEEEEEEEETSMVGNLNIEFLELQGCADQTSASRSSRVVRALFLRFARCSYAARTRSSHF